MVGSSIIIFHIKAKPYLYLIAYDILHTFLTVWRKFMLQQLLQVIALINRTIRPKQLCLKHVCDAVKPSCVYRSNYFFQAFLTTINVLLKEK